MEHNVHHSQFAHLEKDQTGEMWLMTEEDYRVSPLWKKVAYRIGRHPLFLLLAAPYLLFVVRYRWSVMNYKHAWYSVLLTDVLLLAAYGSFMAFASGPSIAVMLLSWYVAGAMAVGLFYVQHAFEGAQYFKGEKWDFGQACVENCSQLMLPKWLDFFTGNISYHHLHHLSSKIPCYKLPTAQRLVGHMVPARQVRLSELPAAFRLGLWSEARGQMVGF